MLLTSRDVRLRPGMPWPLGATWIGSGINFALFSENATGVELCLFDAVDVPSPSPTPLPKPTAWPAPLNR